MQTFNTLRHTVETIYQQVQSFIEQRSRDRHHLSEALELNSSQRQQHQLRNLLSRYQDTSQSQETNVQALTRPKRELQDSYTSTPSSSSSASSKPSSSLLD
jgi:flagellar biosynthesis chaperone FliJ